MQGGWQAGDGPSRPLVVDGSPAQLSGRATGQKSQKHKALPGNKIRLQDFILRNKGNESIKVYKDIHSWPPSVRAKGRDYLTAHE